MFINSFFHNFIFGLFIPSFSMTVLCFISVLLYKDMIKVDNIKKYFNISILSAFTLNTGSFAIILPIFAAIMVHELKQSENEQNRIKMLINIYVSCFISVLSDFIIYETVNEKLEDYSTIPIKYKFIGFIISLILIILIGMIIRISGEKKVLRNLSLKRKKYMMIVSISIPLTILIALIGSISVFGKEKVGFIMGNFFPQVFPLISIILICIIVYDYNKSIEIGAELERQVREKREIDEYSHVIEDMYSETRRFKHDYINMLSPLKEYIDNSDIKGLHKFFYENVIDMDSDIKWGSSNIDKLKYIKDTGLKAILSTKLIKALSVNIDIKVEIVENIPDVSMNIMDLCRIVGILMDNAVEAAQECEHPKIKVCIVRKNDYVVIVIMNNYFGEKPVIHKIYKEGFSTKGKSRGLGLYTVKNIIDTKYDNVLLNTSVEENVFKQELMIKEFF